MINLPGRYKLWAPEYLYYSMSDWSARNTSDIGVARTALQSPTKLLRNRAQ